MDMQKFLKCQVDKIVIVHNTFINFQEQLQEFDSKKQPLLEDAFPLQMAED